MSYTPGELDNLALAAVSPGMEDDEPQHPGNQAPRPGTEDVKGTSADSTSTKEHVLEHHEHAEEDGDAAEARPRENQASQLVAFATERVELVHNENHEVFAIDRKTRETRKLDSRAFRAWVTAAFFESTRRVARDQSVREALTTMSGLGRFRGRQVAVHIRVAKHDDAYYLDLAEPGQSRAIRIRPGRWDVVPDPPVHFVRPESMRPLPEPVHGGSLADLWRMTNIPKCSRLLVLAWILESLRPETVFPILELIGEQGTAKSTTQRALRRLFDPNACDLRAAPKATEDIFIAAGTQWLVSFENVSHLSGPMQDALCVLATGGGFASRKLYTNDEEAVIVTQRPVVLNGIAVAITAQDLVDRTISVELPCIEGGYIEETQLREDFAANQGKTLGALIEVMARALKVMPDLRLPAEKRPRLVDFAKLGMATAVALGHPSEAFLGQFNASRQDALARTIDASPVATAILEWLEQHPTGGTADTVKALMQSIERYRPPNCESWPRSPKGFADALRRAAPALRAMGIECRALGEKVGGNYRWEIRRLRAA